MAVAIEAEVYGTSISPYCNTFSIISFSVRACVSIENHVHVYEMNFNVPKCLPVRLTCYIVFN